MLDLEHIPAFLLDRAIHRMTEFRKDIDVEIMRMRREKLRRDWKDRHARRMDKIAADLIQRGQTDTEQAVMWLMEQGHREKYAREILSAMQTRIERQKKAAREVEIFRRWNIGKEKKTALAREFGLSRATVERICSRMLKNGEGLSKNFRLAASTVPQRRIPVVKKPDKKKSPA